jgi:undecaprenyl-phosphate galactose phosphotransferase
MFRLDEGIATGRSHQTSSHLDRRVRGRRASKRAFDLIVGALLLVISAPLFGLICWQVGRTGRPILYRHRRIGHRGEIFECLKFRTMVPDAERVLAEHLEAHPGAREEWQRRHKLRNDPRITRFGAWLRRTSLDELPQVINVLRGEMSLVGPRPVPVDEVADYGRHMGRYMAHYLASTPGLTGLWQISGRSELDYERRVQLDCWYMMNRSLWMDVWILIRTPRAVIRGDGAY